MSRNTRRGLSRLFWSVTVGVLGALILAPACASVAHAQPMDVEPEAVALDLAGLALWATVLALGTEWIRSLVPSWRRGGPEMGELAKTGLRIVPVALGVAAGLSGWAPAVGDGSQPEVFGGIGAGLIASLFGGSLVGAVRDRLPGRRRVADMTTGQFRAHRAAEQGEGADQ